MTVDFASHAQQRTSQRGFNQEFLEMFYSLQDIVEHSHGRECLRVSRTAIERCLNSKRVSATSKTQVKQNYSKLLKTIIVQASAGKVITIKYNWSQK